MRWFRANRRLCGRLALFALALQIGLSFGHVHADDVGRQTVALSAANSQADRSPAGDEHRGRTDDTCAICATIALAGSLLLPEPPALIIARRFLDTPAPDRAEALVPGDHPLHTRARSPPG
jgi:hypothetical protein